MYINLNASIKGTSSLYILCIVRFWPQLVYSVMLMLDQILHRFEWKLVNYWTDARFCPSTVVGIQLPNHFCVRYSMVFTFQFSSGKWNLFSLFTQKHLSLRYGERDFHCYAGQTQNSFSVTGIFNQPSWQIGIQFLVGHPSEKKSTTCRFHFPQTQLFEVLEKQKQKTQWQNVKQTG